MDTEDAALLNLESQYRAGELPNPKAVMEKAKTIVTSVSLKVKEGNKKMNVLNTMMKVEG